MRRARVGVLALLALAASARPGAGQEEPARQRVLMLSAPAGLTAAVEAALAGWPIDVSAAAGDPGASMPKAGEKARALGQAAGAGAVVWIASDGTGHAVWVLDVASGRVAARRLPQAPPYDDAAAAAVALTVKTLLRHSQAAPVLERYGVEEARAALRSELAAARPPAPRRPPAPLEAPFRLETLAGARVRRSQASDVELRLGAGLRYAPAWLGGRGAALARIRSGAGVGLDEPDFVGRYTDLTASLGAAARFLAPGTFALVPALGASLHFTSIDGSIRTLGARGRARRVNPSLDGGLAVEIQVGHLVRLSVGGEVSYALRRQAYLVRGDPVLTLPRFEGEIAAAVSVPLD